jgi:protein-tyrosine kinase
MSRVHEAMRRAAAEAGHTGTEPVLLRPEAVDAPFMSPWEFDEPFSERPPVSRHQAVPAPQPRVVSVTRGPVATPTPALRQPLMAALPSGTGPTGGPPPRPGIAAAIPLESLMAMKWPQPFAPEVTGKLVATPGTNPVAVEQYRQLAARMVALQQERSTKVLFVTSPRPGAGKSLTAANLGLCLAETFGRRVLLVDANAPHPGLHRIFQVSAGRGITGGLASAIELTKGLVLLPGGRGSADPACTPDLEVMRTVMTQARGAFDWVIVEGPATAQSPGTRALAELTDATLLVIEPGKTAARDAEEAVDLLGRDRLAGLVLNRVSDAFAQQGLDAGGAAR